MRRPYFSWTCFPDVQVVNLQFVSGATATLQMVAFTEKVYARKTRFYGSKVNKLSFYVRHIMRKLAFLKTKQNS